jgi:hypothetical protein
MSLDARELESLREMHAALGGAQWAIPWNLSAEPSKWFGVVIKNKHVM